MEIHQKKRGVGKNKRLDLAVLRENGMEIKVVNGSKYFPYSSIEHAIEIKFIKNRNIPPKNLLEKNFKREFMKLRGLGEPKSKHLVIFSNKNIFQLGEKDEEQSKISNERFEKLESKFKKENVIVEDCYPGKKLRKNNEFKIEDY